MKTKNKNAIFICSVTENSLKVIKCAAGNNLKKDFLGLEVKAIPSDTEDKKLSEELIRAIKNLGYERNPVIISLPRSQATCRYLKVPAQAKQEVENISYLQAARFLPYPANELITAFQIISTDKESYSDINLVIVHRNIIERYFKIFKELKPAKISIVLSSYGLCNLYNYIRPDDSQVAMLIDIDYQEAELAIVSKKKLLFSRSVKLNRQNFEWVNLLIEEVVKTREAYLKSVSQEAPTKIMFVGANKVLQGLTETLNKELAMQVEILNYSRQINMPKELSNIMLDSQYSFASLIGQNLGRLENSLNLLPQELKREETRTLQRKRILEIFLLTLAVIFIWVLGAARNLDSKARQLRRLKSELNKISQQAKPLETIEKRFKFLENRILSQPNSLEVVYELHQIVHRPVTLTSLSYEDGKEVLLRGQTPELDSVSAFVEQLEKSPVFKPFSIKVRYATERKTPSGEIVDFEIDCLRK